MSLISKGAEVQIAQHRTIRGTARELIVSDFLKANLPSTCNFNTGEIIDSDGGRSGQVDVIVTPSSAPHFSLGGDSVISLAEGTVAALEIKSSLTTSTPEKDSELTRAMKTTMAIKGVSPKCDVWPWTAVRVQDRAHLRLETIPVSIVAFEGPEPDTLSQHLSAWNKNVPRKLMPDTITVLNRNYTLVLNNEWLHIGALVTPPDCLYAFGKDTGFCLADLFRYLMTVIQAWTYAQPRTPLVSYLR